MKVAKIYPVLALADSKILFYPNSMHSGNVEAPYIDGRTNE